MDQPRPHQKTKRAFKKLTRRTACSASSEPRSESTNQRRSDRQSPNGKPLVSRTKDDIVKLFYSNCDNSLLSKLAEVSVKAISYDVICITEIKPKNGSTPDQLLLEIPGFSMFCSDLNAQHSRGVCIYVRSSLNAQVYTDEHTSSFKDAVWIQIHSPGEATLIGCIYRSGSPETARLYDNSLHDVLRHVSQLDSFSQHLIVGDFNHSSIRWNPEPEDPTNVLNTPESNFIECYRDTFYHQHTTEPTRFRENQRPSQLDLVFSKELGFVSTLTYGPPLGASDHVSLEIELNFELSLPNKERKIYHYDRADYRAFNHDILEINWNEAFDGASAQVAIDTFQEKLQDLTSKHIPFHTVAAKEKPTPIWMNKHAMKLVKKKHHAWIRYLNTKDQLDYQHFKGIRNSATHALRSARQQYERRLAAECKTNPKAIWRYINSSLKRKSKLTALRKPDGEMTTSDSETSEILNEQFFSVFTRERVDNIPQFRDKDITTPPLSEFTVTEGEVLKHLKKLKTDKSPGLDEMHPRILKEVAHSIAGPLTIIYSKTLAECTLPSQWKDALVSPIFKKGNRFEAQNYRPVSLTSILCKLLERILVDQIQEHIRRNALHCKHQHGFTSGRSTVTNLLEAMNIWTEALMHGLPVDVIYLDFAKAFDSVPHQRLIHKVKSFGITGSALGWIESFLNHRRQKVSVNGVHSTWKPVLSGVPQGSVLGPLLFLLYVADMPEEISNFISMFADDTKLFNVIMDSTDPVNLQEDLDRLQQWSRTMCLRFNTSKCHILHLGRQNSAHEYSMSDNGNTRHKLDRCTEERDLGVIVDDKLNFSPHIEMTVKKANRILGCIRHSFKHMDKHSFMLLYKSLVRPILEYASPVWSPHLKKHINLIEQVQRRATRLIPDIRHLSYPERLQHLELPTLKFRRLRADLIQCFKLINGTNHISDENFCKVCPPKTMLQPSRATRSRGHSKKLQLQFATGHRYHFFSNRVTAAWNSLKEDTVSAPSIQNFKSLLARDLAHHPDLHHHQF